GCAWIGSRTGVEARRAPERDIAYFAIPTGKLRRYWAWQNVVDLGVSVPAGVASARRLLGRLRPRVVFATGGFVALPVVLAAATLRLPIVIHEQTTAPGLANRIGARFARRIAVTFPDGGGHFPPGKVVVTGNPLRPELRGGSPDDAVRRFGLDAVLPLVYVTGGVQGAQRRRADAQRAARRARRRRSRTAAGRAHARAAPSGAPRPPRRAAPIEGHGGARCDARRPRRRGAPGQPADRGMAMSRREPTGSV